MATDLIRYDLLVQSAFREIFRKVLSEIATKGLPGEHHFLVTFRTGAPGVKISDRLKSAHPQDMTIVLQHQFWDLVVTDVGFSVGLSFKNVAEKLVIPFSAVTGFFDPSVNFGAEFTVETDDAKSTSERPMPERSATDRPLALATSKGRATKGSGSEPAEVAGRDMTAGNDQKASPSAPAEAAKPAAKAPDPAPSAEPKVVSIDAFRKKT